MCPSAGLRLLEYPHHAREQRGHGCAVVGVGGDTDADRDGQPLGLGEPKAEVHQAGPNAVDDRLEVGDDVR